MTDHRLGRRGRSLTGARIETRVSGRNRTGQAVEVAPSRERGSKRRRSWSHFQKELMSRRSLTGARIETGVQDLCTTEGCELMSLPHGSADRNDVQFLARPKRNSRSLTGARIETLESRSRLAAGPVAPSRERGSKHPGLADPLGLRRSLPHGSADRNTSGGMRGTKNIVSLPHGSADRNPPGP